MSSKKRIHNTTLWDETTENLVNEWSEGCCSERKVLKSSDRENGKT